ncbi:MAG: hypothetical protein A1D16_05635 [Flavihumibacter sp. CACIAM 22H1]|nr:MAG: hypothetical protein A1D16_05635 [Flavihumibacter sp. CACIAM 22H1]
MKKRKSYTILFYCLLLTGISCSKKLEKLYYDPDQLSSARIEKLFSELLNNYRVRPSYWEIRTFVAMHTGIYSQTIGYLNTPGVYQQNGSYTESRWNDFYRPIGNGTGTMALYREIEKLYQALNDTEKEKMRVFLQAAQVVWYDQACQMVDLWGDIPFSEAGSLNARGEPVMAKFDDAAAIYTEAIAALKALNQYFSEVQPDVPVRNLFATQDFLLTGDLQKWRSYANGLRLRLLMRISGVQENFARQEVREMLAQPELFPLLSTQDRYQPQQEDILLQPLANYTLNLRDALTELTNHPAPYFLLESAMLPVKDPRIPVFFDKNGANPTYKALPINWTLEQQQVNLGKFAVLDSATFLYNARIPGIVITAAELSFLKAEAFLRWGGGDAEKWYYTGIQQSIQFYYHLQQLNSAYKQPEPFPGAEELAGFLQEPGIQLMGSSTEKLEKIALQRWVHFGFLQANQAWAEQRRTGFPVLNFPVNSQPEAPTPPKRLLYPGNEITYNVNYGAVRDKDKLYFPIFWAN